MRIAIIGTGISGLGAAWALRHRAQITLFEAGSHFGGHTHTVDVDLPGEAPFAVDTGFLVLNERTYPKLQALFAELNVPLATSDMSFSVQTPLPGGSTLEWSGSNLDTVFAQRRNLTRPAFWRMLRDILRFNRSAADDLEQGRIPDGMLLGDYLARGGYSREFRDWYLVPMGAAIWSSGTRGMAEFPVEFFVRFFRNHGLLTVTDQPQWRTIRGGSRAYLDPLTRRFAGAIRTGDPVTRVTREADGVTVETRAGHRDLTRLVSIREKEMERILMNLNEDEMRSFLVSIETVSRLLTKARQKREVH